MKMRILTFFLLMFTLCVNAQVGYQVVLIDTKTGEPRKNETVTVNVIISNSEGATVLNETKSATSDDSGIISLTVGTDKSFMNMDWSKLPLFISASVGDLNLGKSQILNIPIAECAKALTPMDLTKVVGRWESIGGFNAHETMSISGTSVTFYVPSEDGSYSVSMDIKSISHNSIVAFSGEYSVFIMFSDDYKYCTVFGYFAEGAYVFKR